MRLIAADVGGTKTLLRCVEHDGRTSREGRYDSASYRRFEDLTGEFLAGLPGPVDAACFAVAGPVRGGVAHATNLEWTLSERELETTLGIPTVTVVNDFFALAYGVPFLADSDLLSLNRGERDPDAPVAVLGAGTGLGEAFVVRHNEVHHVLATEGGHCDFAPQDEEQTRLFLQLHERLGHVSWERLLSGSGLVNIFMFLGGEELDPAEIAERAERGDRAAVRAFEIFADLYGAEAGNMALRLLTRGGVFLAGGIAAKNPARFTDGRFREAYLRKGRFAGLVESIPVDLILNEEVGLLGAVALARKIAAARG